MTPLAEKISLHSDKIQPTHWNRLAIVYVRQSTLQQVIDHQESTRLQYGLTDRAQALGWSQDRIIVIDEDLGKSGVHAENRSGFQRLVAEVGLDHVGIILGIEMSRLARCSKDWHQLLEICGLFGTLIADTDGVYDPSQYNDRLLLGLKGTMSEAELHILKQRLQQGKLQKARRGELHFPLPIGYVRNPSGEIAFDPDAQVQQVVRLIFRKFEELGTLHALLRYLVDHEIQWGIRVRVGPNKGELEWHPPNRMTLQNLLKNPMYAGAYVYGRRQTNPRKQQPGRPGTGRVVSACEDWHVLLPNHLPAYISWEQYQQHLAQLSANQTRADARGVVREGGALLGGLLICGRCGYRMTVRYSGRNQRHEYLCSSQATNYGGTVCHHIAGGALDSAITQQVLAALQPTALELSLAAAAHLEQERTELNVLWQQRLERATMEAERAGRHYRLIEPENRLVARQLACQWEEKLAIQQKLQEDYQRFCQQQPQHLSEIEQQRIRQLAHDIPSIWNSSSTTNAQRKQIIRQIINHIKVNTIGNSEKVELSIEWIGGQCTEHLMIRPVAKLEQLSYYPQLCKQIQLLVEQGKSATEIARHLNEQGFRPPKRRLQFSRAGVQELMRHLGLYQRCSPGVDQEVLPQHEWWLPELARYLEMPDTTLYHWLRRGWVNARQQQTSPYRLIVWADEAELERLKQLRQQPMRERLRQSWLNGNSATSPKP